MEDVERPVLLRVLQEQQQKHEMHVEQLLEQHLAKIVNLFSDNCSRNLIEHRQRTVDNKKSTTTEDGSMGPAFPLQNKHHPSMVVRKRESLVSWTPAPRVSEQEQAISEAKGDILKDKQFNATKQFNTFLEFQQLPTTRGQLQLYCERIVQHPVFQAIVMLMIGISTLALGLDIDWSAKYPGEEFPHIMTINLCLTCLFLIEILFRIAAEGAFFIDWTNEGVFWNLLDSVLVMSSLFEEIYSRTVQEGALVDVSQTRLLRCLRLVRMVRVIRILHFFQDLRVMVMGISSSMKPLVFALLLLFMIVYMVAVCMMQFSVEYVQTQTNETAETLNKFFNDMGDTMYTLFACITGGVDWVEVGNALFAVHTMLGMVFVLYIAFGSFCVLNIITGVFVESAMKHAEADDDQLMLAELEQKSVWLSEVKSAFLQADQDARGALNLNQFTNLCGQKQMRAMLTKLGVDFCISSPEQLFKVMDIEENNLVDVNDFVAGLVSMRGYAKSLQVSMLTRDIKRLRSEVVMTSQWIRDVHQAVWALATSSKYGTGESSTRVTRELNSMADTMTGISFFADAASHRAVASELKDQMAL